MIPTIQPKKRFKVYRFFCNKEIVSHIQVISYVRGPFLFVFNFHPTDSYEGYNVGVEEAGEYQVSVSVSFS